MNLRDFSNYVEWYGKLGYLSTPVVYIEYPGSVNGPLAELLLHNTYLFGCALLYQTSIPLYEE